MYWRQMSAWMLYVVQTSFSGQVTSPTTHSQPTSTPTATPPLADNLMLPLADTPTWLEWNLNTLQAVRWQHTDRHQPTEKSLMQKLRLVFYIYLPALPSTHCSLPH